MDPELLQRLAAAGMTEEQLRMLAPQLHLGMGMLQPQEAQGRNVGGTYVASSPIEHLSNAFRQMVGAKLAGGALGSERDLLAKKQQAIQDWQQAMQTAQQGGSGGTLGTEGGGMARPPDPRAAQQLMMAGAASGVPALQRGAQFGLQEMNYQRQLEMMRSLMGYRGGRLEQSQERIDQAERGQSLGTDIWGNKVMVPKLAPKGGAQRAPSALPGATGALSPDLSNQGAAAIPTTTPMQDGNPQDPRLAAPGAAPQSPPQGGAGGEPERVPGLPNTILDSLTKQWKITGQVPAVPGLTSGAHGLIFKAMSQRAAELYPDIDFAKDKAKYASNVDAHRVLTTQYRSVKAFQDTAERNADVAEGILKKVEDTGIPLANAPVRWVMNKLAGSPAQAQFGLAMQIVGNEYSKIVSGGTMGQRLTDSQRHEIGKEGFSPDITVGQFRGIRQVLSQDAQNRVGALETGMRELEGEMSGKPAEVPKPPGKARPDLRQKYGLPQ